MRFGVLKKATALMLVIAVICSLLMTSVSVFAEETDPAVGSNDSSGDEPSGETITKEIYSLEDYSFFLQNVYLPRGNNHDHQHLGIYLNEGDSFRIRIAGDNTNQPLMILQLFANDNVLEGADGARYTLPDDGSWMTVTAPFDCVPMIKTPVDNNLGTYYVEFETENTHEMPVYVENVTDETEFFDFWETSAAPYGIIESDHVVFLIPYDDRNDMYNTKNKYEFENLNKMLEYFDNMLTQYDAFAGLDDSADADPWDRLVNSRYLIKLDNHGYGLAYYCGNYVAMNGSVTDGSMSGFFYRDWINTHELGHGYGTVFGGQDARGRLDVTEVWNNIYGYYYDIKTRDEEDYWLKRDPDSLSRYEKARTEFGYYGDPTDTYGGYYVEMLFFWLNIFDLDPERLMSEINSLYREDVYKNIDRKYSGVDLYAKYLMEISGYNLIPYFEDWGLDISDELEDSIVRSGKYKNINSLRFFTQTDAQANNILKNLDIRDMYSLVTDDDIKDSGLKGNLKVNITIDNIDELIGKKIKITDGVNNVAECTIEGNTVNTELPIGVYTVILPASQGGRATAEKHVQFVNIKSDAVSEINAVYETGDSNFLSNYKISYHGISDVEYLTAYCNVGEGTMDIERTSVQPHGYFNGQGDFPRLYSYIVITDSDGNEIFRDEQNGDESKAVSQTVPIKEGYIVKVFHREADGRVKISPEAMQGVNYTEFNDFQRAVEMSFRITSYGLIPYKNVTYKTYGATDQDAYAARLSAYLQNLIDSYGDDVWDDPEELILQKSDIVSAVEEKLDKKHSESFQKEFSAVYSKFANVDKTLLAAKIEEASSVLATVKSPVKRQAIETAIEDAQKVISDEYATQVEVDSAIHLLEHALSMGAGVIGDVNHDGSINVSDATLILQRYAGIIDDNNIDYDATLADVDGNRNIDVSDATLVLQIYGGIIQEFPNTNV